MGMGAGLVVLTAMAAVSPSIVSILVVATTISLSVCGGMGLGWGQV